VCEYLLPHPISEDSSVKYVTIIDRLSSLSPLLCVCSEIGIVSLMGHANNNILGGGMKSTSQNSSIRLLRQAKVLSPILSRIFSSKCGLSDNRCVCVCVCV
jgi:hypothetical protein